MFNTKFEYAEARPRLTGIIIVALVLTAMAFGLAA